MNTAILIPARYASTRYPAKPLAVLNGKTMIQRVVEKCLSTGYDTFVLTDNKTIAQAAVAAGAKFYIDSDSYENGTERCAGAIRSRKFDNYDRFINVQGDMPDVTLDMINKAVLCLSTHEIGTVYTVMPKEKQNEPNTVKMIVDSNNNALWFGRGIIGYGEWHLGVYSYSKKALEVYDKLRTYPEENIEKLEQLRWLKNGWQIGCHYVNFNGVEINTPEDLEEWHKKN